MEYSVKEVSEILIRLIKNLNLENINDYITYIDDRPFNDQRYYINNKKLKDLGWTVKIKFMDGLKHMIDFPNDREYKNLIQ